MKVLYIASTPDGRESLGLEREITELQSRFISISGEPAVFIFLPDLKVEDFASVITIHKPDILHISTHAEAKFLSLANSGGKSVELSAQRLKILLDEDALPTIVYLNACNSAKIAEELVGLVDVAIGTTAPITNRAARAGAVQFYERLLQGRSVNNAFEASQAIIQTLESDETSTEIYMKKGVDTKILLMHQNPRIVARFDGGRFSPLRDGSFKIEIGVIGCPRTTTQLVMFTDDESFIKEQKSIEEELCSVSIHKPDKGTIWIDDIWSSQDDFKLFACGVTSDEKNFMISSMICDAIETYYKLKGRDALLKNLDPAATKAIATMRSMGDSSTVAAISDQGT